jgi:hypothetical protein
MKLAVKFPHVGLACALALTSASNAAHFDATLTATAGGVTRKAGMDETPPVGGFNKRPVLQARAGEPVRIEFIMTNVYTHDAFIDSGVRYYIVKEREAGQKPVPPLEGAPVEGSFNFSLKPQAKIAVRTRVAISEPGIYLLRVESFNTQRDHEHFSAIDLDIR